MCEALASYISEVEQGLRRVPRGRRRLFLRELEAHLLDEADARGIADEVGMQGLLAEKDPPERIAAELTTQDEGDTTRRREISLMAGGVIGLATGAMLWFQEYPWYLCLGWCTALGLAVGTSLFFMRSNWQRLSPSRRMMAAIVFGTLLSIPLGYAGTRFWPLRLLYGAFLGYLVERYTDRRPIWQLVLDAMAFSIMVMAIDLCILCREKVFSLWMLSRVLGMNFTIAFAVLAAMGLKRFMQERSVLAALER